MESEQLSFVSAVDFSSRLVEERVSNLKGLYKFFEIGRASCRERV